MSAYLANFFKDSTMISTAEIHALTRLPPETYTVRRCSDGADMGYFPRSQDGYDRARRMRRVLGDGFDVVASVTRVRTGVRAGYYHPQQSYTPERVEWRIESEVVE